MPVIARIDAGDFPPDQAGYDDLRLDRWTAAS
jgi:hypothetical protein